MDISINCVCVSYKELKICFKDYLFKDKNITFITGRNGTGKTTLLKAMGNVVDYQGEINAVGTYVSQEAVMFNKTVYENIVYPLTIRKLALLDYQDKINLLTEKLNIHHLLNKNATKLSSGEKMKVAIIRSIIFSPKVLLLDEPTTHLDLESIEELENLIKTLKKKINIIIVSHNKSFIENLKDKEYRIGV